MDVTILMPMGGLGKRFQDEGYTTPKPMIDVDGMPMFLRALESFPTNWNIDHAFVIRKEQEELYNLRSLIENVCPKGKVAILDHNTRGPTETCFAAESLIDPNKPIIIADCDIRFHSQEYVSFIESESFDGVLVGFDSTDPRYSYAELDSTGRVLRTAEKNPISNHALLGGYYFSSANLFFQLAHRFVDSELPAHLKEYFLSHLYNLLLSQGGTIAFANTDYFDCWGTPEELIAYQRAAR